MTRELTPNEVAVFGALREADEHWVPIYELAPRVRLSWRQVRSALAGLHERELVRRRAAQPRGCHAVEWAVAHG